MTITITAGNAQATDFFAYLDAFDDSFTPSGRGVFSNVFSGDYAVAETEVTDTADLNSQAVIMGDSVAYSLQTHTVSGTIDDIQFGYGATATDTGQGATVDLSLAEVDFTVAFSPSLDDEDAVNDVIYGILGYATAGATDPLVALIQAEAIIFNGHDGDDTFTSFDQDDTLKGREGDDTLSAAGGDDTLKGGAGKDTLNAGQGDDAVNGGDDGDTINGGKGNDDIKGGKGNDDISGGGGADIISGGNGADVIDGNGGGDEILAGQGADIVNGGKGNDVLKGGKGGDTIDGGEGNDMLTGGNGSDTFVFTGIVGTDTILDFNAGKDVIDLSALSGEANSFNQVLSALTEDGNTLVYDFGNDGDTVLILTGVAMDDLSASDFIL